MNEVILEERIEENIDILHLQGSPGYQMEHLMISRTLNDGLRLEIADDGEYDEAGSDGWWCFHIKSPEAAKLIAERLLAYAERHFR